MYIIPRDSRKVAESLIRKYHDQLTKGCGQESCDNPDCATGSGKALDATAAAIKAIKLAKQGKLARLCVDLNYYSSSENMRLSSKNSFTSTGSSTSLTSKSLQSGETESMDTTDSLGEDSSIGVEPSSSTDSAASSTLILVTSHMDTTGQSSRSRPAPSAGPSTGIDAVTSSGRGKVTERRPTPHPSPLPHIGTFT